MVVAGVIAILAGEATSVFSFATYPSFGFRGSPHDQITDAAATGIAVGTDVYSFKDTVITRLQYSVRMPDWMESSWLRWFTWGANAGYRPEHHCDRNPGGITDATYFANTAAYIRGRLSAAITAAQGGDQTGALTTIGQGLHALQDCFSHSNYVILDPVSRMHFDAVLWNTPPPPIGPFIGLVLTGWNPDPTTSDPERPPGDPYPHADFALDKPKKNAWAVAHYRQAFSAAIAYSKDFLARVLTPLTPAQRNALLNTAVALDDIYTAHYRYWQKMSCGATGCVVSAGPASVQFFPGTFPLTTEVAVLGADNHQFYTPDDTEIAHPFVWTVQWLEISPNKLFFSPPAFVTWSYSAADVADLRPETLGVYWVDPDTGQWEQVAGVVFGGVAEFFAQASGTYAIGGVRTRTPGEAWGDLWTQEPEPVRSAIGPVPSDVASLVFRSESPTPTPSPVPAASPMAVEILVASLVLMGIFAVRRHMDSTG